MAISQTLVLVKPDGVSRGLIGNIMSRFEKRGLKIVGLKMTKIDKNFAQKHYTEDIAERRGQKVRDMLLNFITSHPVVAMCIEGVDAVENVRKIVGETQPLKAIPGTIRGDYAHISYSHASEKDMVVQNLVHASGNQEEAKAEVSLWFSIDELHEYKHSYEERVF